MRIGIIALLHESNTFLSQPTTYASFRQSLLCFGEPIRDAFADAHHEVGGFFAGLQEAGATAVPLFAARALPSGTIEAETFSRLVKELLDSVEQALPLDGILVAPHGATVSEQIPDADGHWLAELRRRVGYETPIIGTLDAHANLSQQMVQACDALIAYRTNPHLDQRERGIEAAELMVRTVRHEVHPIMAAEFPPLAISIDRQCTDEEPLKSVFDEADRLRNTDGILSNSLLLGFPYADVAEMGAAVISVADGNRPLAERSASELADRLWRRRNELTGQLISVDEAIQLCRTSNQRTCLLDMGDNVGGGSAADGTELLAAIDRHSIGPSFGCLYDPEAVAHCEHSGVGAHVSLSVGGKTDASHGRPLELNVRVASLHDGIFHEPQPRHGGISEFDQGRTAICETDRGMTLMLTSRRMVPFSLQQLVSCHLDPKRFRILVAKGVNAPIAAYRPVCDRFIRVNTAGATCADLHRLGLQHRRRPMFPWERDL